MAFTATAAALSIASAVVAIGGPSPWGTGGPAIVRACDPEGAPREPVRLVYDLPPLEIQPSVRGPRHRGALSYRRTVEEVSAALDGMQRFDLGPFRACYRWARWAKPELAGDLTIGIEVDEWGRVARVAAATDPIDPDVAACFSDVLAGARVGFYTPRRTVMEVRFRLQPSGQAPPKRRPPRPATPRRASGNQRVCVEQPTVLPVDVSDDPARAVVVDDFSKQQADDETREQHRANVARWIAGRRRGPEPKLPREVIACGANVRGVPHLEPVEAAVGFQRGDFEACYAEAARRGYQRGGDVTLAAVVNRAGQFEAARVQTSTTKDARLDRCLARALEHAHVVTGLGGVFRVRAPLHLAPGRAPIPFTRDDEDLAGDAIDEGDDATARTLYRAALAKTTVAPRRCAIAVGLLQAALTSAPWQEDERVSAAVDEVREALRAAPGAALATCLKQAMPLLASWVARPVDLAHATRRPGLMAPALDRVQRLLAFDPPLPVADTLRVLRKAAVQLLKPSEPGSGCCGRALPWPSVAELHGVMPEPSVGAMQVRDALIYLRSLWMTGHRDLRCREAFGVVAQSWGDHMRLLRFQPCSVPSGGMGILPPPATRRAPAQSE